MTKFRTCAKFFAVQRIADALPPSLIDKAIFSPRHVMEILSRDDGEQRSTPARIGSYVPGTEYDMSGSWDGSEDHLPASTHDADMSSAPPATPQDAHAAEFDAVVVKFDSDDLASASN